MKLWTPYRIAITAALCLCCGVGIAEPPYSLHATVKFVRGQIAVLNNDGFNWDNCTLSLNPSDPDWWFVIDSVDVGSHSVVTFKVSRFKTDQGDIYNPKAHPPVSMRIVCSTPDGGRSATEVIID